MTPGCPQFYDDKTNRSAQGVLDTLERWDNRFKEHYDSRRGQPRQLFRTIITVAVPPMTSRGSVPFTFQAWARNISRGGLAFIHPGELKVANVLICLAPVQSGQSTWFSGQIVRARPVQDRFWEYGVCFKVRFVSETPEPTACGTESGSVDDAPRENEPAQTSSR